MCFSTFGDVKNQIFALKSILQYFIVILVKLLIFLGDEVTVIISETKSSNKNENKLKSSDEITDTEQDESFEIIDVKDNDSREKEFRVRDISYNKKN